MASTEQPCDNVAAENQTELHLLPFSKDGRLWLTSDSNGNLTPLRVLIPKWSRVAREATRAVQSSFQLSVFCLYEFSDDSRDFLVARLLNPSEADSRMHSFVPSGQPIQGLSDVLLRVAVRAHREVFLETNVLGPEPFKHIDWLAYLQSRLEPVLAKRGIWLTGEVEQINAEPTFSLLKMESSTQPLWFKSVGEPNLAEYTVTTGLAMMFPGVMPSIVADIPEWHGWVTENAQGSRLDSSSDVADWKFAASRFAEIQISSLQHISELLDIGCVDCKTSELSQHLELFVEAMERAMVEDGVVDQRRLERGQIREIADSIKEGLAEISRLGVPDALVHRDLSGGNIQISTHHCHFIDWAQACVSCPFICSEYLRAHFVKANRGMPDLHVHASEVTAAYTHQWIDVLTIADRF